MKINKKAFTIIPLFFIAFLFVLPLVAEAHPCRGTAAIECKLNNAVAQGDTVTCAVKTFYFNCSHLCNTAIGEDSCQITEWNTSCSIGGHTGGFDCACSPLRVRITAINGVVGTAIINSSSSCKWGSYPYYDRGYFFTWSQNPDTCSLTVGYTPPADTTAPSASLWNNTGGAWVNWNPTWSWSASDSGSGLRSPNRYYIHTRYNWGSWAGDWYTDVTSWSGSAANNGEYEVYIYAIDNAGNWGGAPAWSYAYVDKTAPSISLSVSPTGWTSGNPTWSWSASDANSGLRSPNRYYYYLDGVAQGYTDSTSYTPNLGTGSHSVYVYAIDNAGNWGGSGYVYGYVDKTAPTGSHSPTSRSWASADASATISYSDDRGISYVRHCWTTGSSCDPGTSNSSTVSNGGATTQSSNGSWNLCSRARDGVGNWSSSLCTGLYQIDKTAPTVTINSPAADSSQNSDFWVNVSDSDSLSGLNFSSCQYRVYDHGAGIYTKNWTSRTCNSSQSFKVTVGSGKDCRSNNNYCTVYVQASDNAANQGSDNRRFKAYWNSPPVANFSCTPTNCTIYTGEALTLNNSSSDPDNNLARSEWDVLSWGSAPDLTCCASGCDSTTVLCNYTVQSLIVGNGAYNIKLTVKDALNETASLTKPFNIKQDAIADFKCSLDNSSWQSCADFKAKVNEKVYFLSQSSPSEGASITSWSWVFQDATPPIANTSNPQTKFSKSGVKTVSLTIQDSAGRTASRTYNLKIQISVPEWEEIAPF